MQREEPFFAKWVALGFSEVLHMLFHRLRASIAGEGFCSGKKVKNCAI